MADLQSNQADFFFTTDAYPNNELRVTSFQGREAISRPFDFEVSLTSTLDDIDLESMIGQPVLLTIRGLSGTRFVHGIIERFEQLAVGRKLSHYTANIGPTLIPLRYTRSSRIFREMSAVEIIEKVITGAGYPGDALRKVLRSKYAARDYCVQYQESDWHFISRLMEEEGIFFFFSHEPMRDVLVMGDGEHAVEMLPDAPSLNFRDESRATALEEEHFYRFQGRAGLAPNRATMRDFRFKQPRVNMEVTQTVNDHVPMEIYYYPGEYVEPELGKRLVQIRLEEAQARKHRYLAIGTTRSLIPGYQFQLELHPRADFNRKYLVVEVDHHATQPQMLGEETGAGQAQSLQYTCHTSVLPSEYPFRPSRDTPRPQIPGIQSAVVVGPSGQEIHCDEYGRVKVQFHWDREGRYNDHSSCWVRVNQPWAGIGNGGILLPRIGQEVLIQFIEGDPDRPVIIGRVFNADNPVPYGLPDNKTRTTFKSASSPGGAGFNELRFEDRAGLEEIYMHAQRDWNTDVLRHKNTNVGVNRSVNIGSNDSTNIGINKSVNIGNNQVINVGGEHYHHNCGPMIVIVERNHSLTVNANLYASIALDLNLSINANINVSVGIDVNIGIDFNINFAIGIDINLSPGGKLNLCAGIGMFLIAPVFKALTIDYSVHSLKASICALTLDLTGVAMVNMTGGLINVSGGLVEICGGAVQISGGVIRLN